MKEVLITASCGMSFVMILGGYYDAAMAYYYPKPKTVSYVDCSIEIINMARKLNVTIIDRCKIDG